MKDQQKKRQIYPTRFKGYNKLNMKPFPRTSDNSQRARISQSLVSVNLCSLRRGDLHLRPTSDNLHMRLHDCMHIYREPSQVDVEVTHNPSRVLQVTAFSSEVDVKKKRKKNLDAYQVETRC